MFKMISVVLGALGAIVSGILVYQSASAFKSLPPSSLASAEHSEEAKGEHGNQSHSEGGHEASTSHEGGGHESGGGHEASASHESGGHEASSSHESGHDGRAPASIKSLVPFVSMDEVFANISDDKTNHTVAIKLDIEFFDDKAKQAFKTSQPSVKDMIIQTSREQSYDQLSTLSGKLYFKELLIRKMNEYFQKPLVRDIHFASFFLQ